MKIKRTILVLLFFLFFSISQLMFITRVNADNEQLPEGLYTIYVGVGENKVIDIANGSESSSANVQIYESNNTAAQIFRLIKTSDGYYEIMNKNSGKVLDIQNGVIHNGANVWQYERNNTDAQKWKLVKAGDNSYYLLSKLNLNYSLDINEGKSNNGTNVQVYEFNKTPAQRFTFKSRPAMESKKTIEDGEYKIISYLDQTKSLDITGGSTATNANVQIYADNGTKAQNFMITYGSDGYYTILNQNSNKPISIKENDYSSGGNVFQGSSVNSDAQKWIIRKNTDGTVTIFSKESEMCLDIAGGSKKSGANVQQYKPNGTNAQKWILVPKEDFVSEQVLQNGTYNLFTSLHTEMLLDIDNSSKSSGAYVELEGQNNALAQRFNLEFTKDGYYKIVNKNSGKVLDVENGVGEAGTKIWQYEYNNTNAQKWIIKKNEKGTYNIVSKLNGLYLTAENSNAGTILKVYHKNGLKNQEFNIKEYKNVEPQKDAIADGVYQIVLKNNKVLDIDAGKQDNFANVQIWGNTKVQQQKFRIEQIDDTGFYTITSINSGKVLDVQEGKQEVGTNVAQYESNKTDSQKWSIKKTDGGYYNIISKCNNLALDIQGGLSNKNGTNVQVYFFNNTDAQKFKLEPIEIVNAGTYEIETALDSNKILDVSGGNLADYANVQIWQADNVNQQRFTLEYVDGGCIFRAKHSNKVLTVDTNTNNVYQSTYNNSLNQKWEIRETGNGYYNIISKYNGLYIDINNASTANGTNVKVYNKNNSANAQKFRFVTGFRRFYQEGTYGQSGYKVAGDWRGSDLKYYKIGKGQNVLFATFSIHGFEDSYSNDGQELVYIAEQFKNYMQNSSEESIINNWTIYIFPCLNPDGAYHGWTNDGPGRTTLYSAAPGNKGIDMNRSWSVSGESYPRYTSSREYNGTEGFQAYESRALRDFLLSHKSASGQTLLIDLHGWLNETIGDNGLGGFYRSQFGMSTHIGSYGRGYLVNWARKSLGNGNRTARSALIELPQVYSHQDTLNRNYAQKYINATINMLKGV